MDVYLMVQVWNDVVSNFWGVSVFKFQMDSSRIQPNSDKVPMAKFANKYAKNFPLINCAVQEVDLVFWTEGLRVKSAEECGVFLEYVQSLVAVGLYILDILYSFAVI